WNPKGKRGTGLSDVGLVVRVALGRSDVVVAAGPRPLSQQLHSLGLGVVVHHVQAEIVLEPIGRNPPQGAPGRPDTLASLGSNLAADAQSLRRGASTGDTFVVEAREIAVSLAREPGNAGKQLVGHDHEVGAAADIDAIEAAMGRLDEAVR